MLITKVELEDIKSHKSWSREFQRGTTAITGANGAGKTSIIEAIAWALFDFLDYNKDDFVRRGARKGTVRVTFQSGLDDKFYTVIRDTGGKHRIFDEESRTIIHEQNANVMNFIRQHLQVEPGTNLKELYRAAIGVPQGTFTAVFLDNPNNRKAVFDRLLKVEEYRESSKKLGDTVNLIRQKQSEVNQRLARAEGELANYEQTEIEHKQIGVEISDLEKSLMQLREEIEKGEETVKKFDEARNRLDNAQNNLRDLTTKQQNTAFQFTNVQRERDAAQTAAAIVKELETDYQIYLEAETERGKLEKEREERDLLKNQQAQIDKNLINAKAENQILERDLARALAAGREADALKPQIAEQERLEEEYKKLLELRAEAQAAQKRVDELEPQIAAKRNEYTELNKSIKDGEKGANAQAEIVELEKQKKQVESELQSANEGVARLDVLHPQLQQLQRDAEKTVQNLDKIKADVSALEKLSVQAARVEFLVESETALAQKIADVRAASELDAKFMNQVKRGVCPILPDKCLNLREEDTLKIVLNGSAAANDEQLKTLEIEQKQISVELVKAREAERETARLSVLREQTSTLQKQQSEREKTIETLKREITDLSGFTPERRNNLREEKARFEAELKNLYEAAQSYAVLGERKRQIESLKEEGIKLGEEQKKLKTTSEKFGEIEKTIAINQNRLRELDNPKGRAMSCLREAERESEYRTKISEIKRKIEQLEAEKQNLDAQLARFAALDEKLAEVRAALTRTQSARDEYLRNQTVAEKLPELETKLQELTAEVERLKIEVEKAEAEHETARQSYDAEQHTREKTVLNDARTDSASKGATLTAKQMREAQLKAVLERLSEVREKMRGDFDEQERLRKVFETTDYIRETLKKAAPHVGEILRYQVAKEATNIFREVAGEIGRSLKWTEDYEILLDENGYQRSFGNLSGGEQMAAALSIRLALLTQLSDVRIAFFDEPTTNLDRERRERLAQQIGQISSFNQLFVISHDDTFESNVDHQINVGDNISE